MLQFNGISTMGSESKLSKSNSSLNENCHTENLIEAVRKSPTIWKSSDPKYNDKEAKKEAWQGVLTEVCPDLEYRNPMDLVQMSKFKRVVLA